MTKKLLLILAVVGIVRAQQVPANIGNLPSVAATGATPTGWKYLQVNAAGQLYLANAAASQSLGGPSGFVQPVVMVAQGPTGWLYLQADQYGNLLTSGAIQSCATTPPTTGGANSLCYDTSNELWKCNNGTNACTLTSQWGGVGGSGANNVTATSVSAVTSLTLNLTTLNLSSTNGLLVQCWAGTTTLSPVTITSLTALSLTSVTANFTSTANVICAANATGTGIQGPTGPTGPAGPAPSGTGLVDVVSGVAGVISPSLGGLYWSGSAWTFQNVVINPMTGVGDMIAGGALGAVQRVAGYTTANTAVLTQTGSGSAGAAPVWSNAPAISMANMTNPQTWNQNTTGTAAGFTSYPTLCTGVQFSQGLSAGSNNCATPVGSVTTSGSPAQYQISVFSASAIIAGISPGSTSGVPLLSQGASAYPAFGALNLAGGASIVTGTLPAGNLPTATAAAKGVVQGDNSTITISAGVESCTTATTSQIGCVKPDGTTITISGGVITAIASGTGTVTTSGSPAQYQMAVFSAGTVIAGISPGSTSGVPLLSQGASSYPAFGALNLAGGASIVTGTLPAGNLPTGTAAAKGVLQGDNSTLTITAGVIACTTATTSQLGCVKPDGTTITISAGVITAVTSGTGNTTSTSLTSGTLPKANGANSIVNSSLLDNGTTVSTTEPISSSGAISSGGATAPSLPSSATGCDVEQSGSNYIGWCAPTTLSQNLYFLPPNAVPTANNVMVFGAPSSGVSSYTFVAESSLAVATAANLASYPTLCTGVQFSQGLSAGSNNCATPSGSGNVSNSGTPSQYQMAVWVTSTTIAGITIGAGQVVQGASSANPSGTATPTLGVQNTTQGSLTIAGSSSAAGVLILGTSGASANGVTIQSLGAAGAYNFNLPTTAGTANYLLTSQGGVTTSMTWSNPSGLTVGTANNISGGAAGEIPFQTGAGASSFTAAGTANQVLASAGTGTPIWTDHPQVDHIPFANCVNTGTAAAGSGPSIGASSGWTPTCLSSVAYPASLQGTPSSGATMYITGMTLPFDWDTTKQPYFVIDVGSGSNTTGTVTFTLSTACVDVSTNGSGSDNPSFNAESATTATMAAASKMWYENAEFAQMTSAHGCKVGSPYVLKIVLGGTASSAINAYQMTITTPRLPVVQAN